MPVRQKLRTDPGSYWKRWRRVASLLLGALLSSWMSWNLVRYFSAILVQPRIEAGERFRIAAGQAFAIAEANLRSGIEQRRLLGSDSKMVLLAGWKNFREPWARDLSFASFGLTALAEFEVVRQSLEAFLEFQLPSGQFPVKFHSTNLMDRYFHSLLKREQPTRSPLRPKYITGHRTVSLDGNALLVIAFTHYVEMSNDRAFLERHWSALQRSVQWLRQFEIAEHGLLHQQPYSDWADSMTRAGHVLYTHVIYWKALTEMARAARRSSRHSAAAEYLRHAEAVSQAIQDHFWRPELGYFVVSREFQNLGSSGNLLAIVWGLASEEQAHRILDTMHASGMAAPVPTQVLSAPYPARSVALENRLAGITGYHMDAAWLWLGAWHVIALARVGRMAESSELLHRIEKLIERDGIVHEAYGRDGLALNTRWYQAEAPLIWNAGMVVYAMREHARLASQAAR